MSEVKDRGTDRRTDKGHRASRKPATPPRVRQRLLVVAQAQTRQMDGVSEQSLDLVLLDRHSSEVFTERFPDGVNGNRDEVVEFAEAHATDYLARRGSSPPHQRYHTFRGTDYHLGDVMLEKEAAEHGYVRPYIDTMCADMAVIASNELTTAEKPSPELDATLTEELRGIGYLSSTQKAVLTCDTRSSIRLDVVDSSEDEVPIDLGESHPIRLLLHPETSPGQMRVVCEFYDQRDQGTFEFLTYISGGK
jgi:hypothetical protein